MIVGVARPAAASAPLRSRESKPVPYASVPHEDAAPRGVRAYFALIGLSLLILAVSGAALSWDGAYYLYQVLNTQTFFTPNARYVNIPLQAPTLLASHLTSNLSALSLVFGLSYAALPLATLLIAWWFVRAEAPSLFAWAALGTGLALLPGQFALINEGQQVVFVFWPIALAPLVRLRPPQWVALAALSAAGFVTHPLAAPLFAATAVVAIVVGLRRRDLRRQDWTMAGAFSLLAIGASLRFTQQHSAYETDQLSLDTLQTAFRTALAGFPLLALCCVAVASLCLFVAPVLATWGRSDGGATAATRALELLCIAGAGLLLLLWAANPREWMGESAYRTWAVFVSLPLMSAAVAEALLLARRTDRLRTDDWPHRRSLALTVGLIFLTVAGVQGAVYAHQIAQLRNVLQRASYACLSASSLPWLEESPLDHWSLTSHAFLLQSRAPQTLIISAGSTCTEERFDQGVPVVVWDAPTMSGGWFALDGLRRRLIAEQDSSGPTGCRYGFGAGWYWVQEHDGERWRWMPRSAQLRVVVSSGRSRITLSADVTSVSTPNVIYLVLDGRTRAHVAISTSGMQALGPLTMHVDGGAHILELVSRGRAHGGNGPTLGFEHLSLTAGRPGHATRCELRP